MHKFSCIHMDFHGFGKDSDGFMCIYIYLHAFYGFTCICMDLGRISVIQKLGCLAGCVGLWRAVAASCSPYILPCSVLGAGRMEAGWMAGWLDGWMAGWLDG